MASGFIVRRNDPCWRERNACIKKCPNTNPNPNSCERGFESPDRTRGRPAVESAGANVAVLGDSSPLNGKSVSLSRVESSATAAAAYGGYVTYHIASYSRRERRDLRNRLIAELHQVRAFSGRIEREFQSRSDYSTSDACFGTGNSAREVTSLPHRNLESQNRKTKKASTAKLSGTKRRRPPAPAVVAQNPKRPARETPPPMQLCRNILRRLMNHKPQWIFNHPVNVVALGLYDYHHIIKRPMDLGTVKSKLANNLYPSPFDFAADVRLTFDNAMVYNPKGHAVYAMAERLLSLFEEMFAPLSSRIPSSTLPEMVKSPQSPPTPIRHPFRYPLAPSVQPEAVGKRATRKLPKPKASDPNKREMTYEEKQRLSLSLQSLSPEKMEKVLQIMRRNSELSQHGDEIEVDIETFDRETLWELDRFLFNSKKTVNKIKKQALTQTQFGATKMPANDGCKSPAGETPGSPKDNNEGMEQDEEDVDIGEEIPSSNFPPVEIDKDATGGACASGSSSRSSSSSSDSSSSSNSDSGSSSGSDSDNDEAQSPLTGVKAASPRT